MSEKLSVIGWTSTYLNDFRVSSFTADRRRAFVERIKKRQYNFNYADYSSFPYCCPFYSDNTICILSKKEFDACMDEAYKEFPRGGRLLPMDVITRPPKKEVLWEKEKWEPKDGENNG